MGIFSLLNRFQKNSKHHYAFAHYALREIAFTNPIRTLNMLCSDHRVEFINDILCQLDTCIEGTHPRNFTGADIGFHGFTIEQRPCVVLQMPRTTNPTEAFFVAIVGTILVEQFPADDEPGTTEKLIQYFTLERPERITRQRRSVFCAWDAGIHLNYGNGPAPTLRKFTDSLIMHLRQQLQSAGSYNSYTKEVVVTR